MRSALSGALAVLAGLGLMAAESASAAPVPRIAAGASPAQIAQTVAVFRRDLGPLNPDTGGAGALPGRREVTWDEVPDAATDPARLPADFFSATVPRGLTVASPSGGPRVSMDGDAPPDADADVLRFADRDPAYATAFQPFSGERIFAPLGTTSTQFTFTAPGTARPAHVQGLGLVFTDVDAPGTTVTYFTPDGDRLGGFQVPASAGSGSLGFVGVSFNAGERVGRVRVTSGTAPLGAAEAVDQDVVAMDDVIYGEPVPTPAPPVVQFSVARHDVSERIGTVRLQVDRTGDLDRTTRLRFVTHDGGAVGGADYVAGGGQVLFRRGEASTIVTVPLMRDTVAEGEEAFSVELVPASGGVLGERSSAAVVIAADQGSSVRTGPAVRLRVRRAARLPRILRKGLRLSLTADREAFAEIRLFRGAKRIATRTVKLEAGHRRKVRYRLSRRARRAIRRVQGNLTIGALVVDAANGARTSATRKVLLKLR